MTLWRRVAWRFSASSYNLFVAALTASVRNAYILSAIVFLGFLIQLAGISLTDESLSPQIVPVSRILTATGYVGILISVLAPALSGVAFDGQVRVEE